MFRSFSTALSGLQANTTALDVVSNNLANLNTAGFKTSSVAFRDLMTQSMDPGSNNTQVGLGAARPVTLRHFGQGTVSQSSGALDAAIEGDGFFMLRSTQGERLYTRAGNFQLDRNGFLRTSTGEFVQGWVMGANGQINPGGPITNISLPTSATLAPRTTTKVGMNLNLDAAAEDDTEFSTTVEVFNAQGKSSMVTMTFTKTGDNAWSVAATTKNEDGEDVDLTLSASSLTFDENGALTAPTEDIEMTCTDPPLEFTWNVLDDAGEPRINQFAAPSAVSALFQDGNGSAQLTRIGMGDGGRLVATYSNGQQVVAAQLALANILNPESMIAAGNNNFLLSSDSAQPAAGLPGTGGRGQIMGGSLEASTVDIAQQFTDLITYQRGYQANSKVITTIDELSQDTINLKR